MEESFFISRQLKNEGFKFYFNNDKSCTYSCKLSYNEGIERGNLWHKLRKKL